MTCEIPKDFTINIYRNAEKFMTREKAKKLLPIIEAYAGGKTIQHFIAGDWHDIEDCDFSYEAENYRIKPRIKKVPMTYEDFLKIEEQIWIKYLAQNESSIVITISNNGFRFADVYNSIRFFTFIEAHERGFKWSTDRVNWRKFEKEVQE